MAFFLRKFLSLLLTFFIILSLTFILMKNVPGDPFSEEQGLPKEIYEDLQRHYGLDKSWIIQYKDYFKSVLTGDLGPSFTYPGRSVNSIIRESFPVSALLGLEALALALPFGMGIGAWAALKQNKWQDQSIIILTTLSISVPNFLLATLLQYILAIKLGWLPVARWGSFAQTLLPAFSLALLPLAFIARLTRTSVLEVLQQDFIKTAKAKGLSSTAIMRSHVLRYAFLPVLSYLGQLITNILVGSFVIEKIFSIPGLGQWFVNSIGNRDYTAIMGLTLFYSAILLVSIFLVDLAYGYLDPRIRNRL